MSCERNRGAFFAQLAAEAPLGQALGGDADTAARCLTTLYETASRRTEVVPVLADALTTALFAEMRGRGLRPPTHSASGLPLPAARQGYAAVMQTLRAIRAGAELPALAQEVRQALGRPTAGEVQRPEHIAPLLASAAAPSAPLDDATAADGAPHPCAPTDPPGPLDPALQALLDQHLCRWPSKRVRQLRDFANGIPPTEPEKLAQALGTLARALQKYAAGQASTVPLCYWAQQFRTGSLAHQHALALALLTTLGRPRCAQCGQWLASETSYHWCPSRTFGWEGYNGFGLDRYGITRWGTRADGTPVPKRRTLLDAGKEFVTPTNPINNPAMADLWGRIASAIAGHECRVVLRAGKGFATDMRGTIHADPEPLGPDADPRHNLIVTKAGIYHEIGHELITPPEDWALMLAIARGEQTVAGIDKGRAMVPKLYNIIEDGHIERELASRFAGVAETLAAQCAIYPRWSERVGWGVPVADEVVWALLYTVLPYFRVRDEVRAAMTPEGRALFEELEPIALGGALGGSEDSVTATLEIARRLEAAGIWDVPKTSATAPPTPGADTPTRALPGAASPAAAAEEATSRGRGAPGAEVAGERALSGAALERVLNEVEDQAIVAAEREIARQGRYDVLGRALHAPLTVNITEPITSYLDGPTITQRYRTPDGRVAAVQTGAPLSTDLRLRAELQVRRGEQQEIAGRLARRLDSIRQETVRRLRLQSEGTLDRRRLPAALAGRSEVRTRLSVEQETGMAVSLLVDQSGSMGAHIEEGRLYDATCIVGQALEQLDIAYEVRGHGDLSLQYKALDEPTLAPERAARLTQDESGSNTKTAPVVGLATTALLAREDQNRLIVNVMDGDMGDHGATVAQYEAARKAGVVTFGVFLGQPAAEQAERMSELFGHRNWRPIGDLKELPAVVGQRIADIFESLGGEG